MVDRGDDKAESEGLSVFGKVRGKCHASVDFGVLLSHMELTVLVSGVESVGTPERSKC